MLLAGFLSSVQGRSPATAEPSLPPETLSELSIRLAGHVAQPRFKSATFGIKIVSAKTGALVFEHDSDELLSPASNAKLYTMALALDRLGPEHRIRTSLYALDQPEGGTIKGDLILFGRGDPCINARLNGGDLLKALQPLVAALTNAGVRKIHGNLVADDSFISGPEFGSGWTWDDLENYYGAEISALTINDNTFEVSVRPGPAPGAPAAITIKPSSSMLTVGNRAITVPAEGRTRIRFHRPVEGHLVHAAGDIAMKASVTEEIPVRRPASLFVEMFRRALESSGVEIEGTNRVIGWLDPDCNRNRLANLVEIASVESPPMRDLARETQKLSQNLYTDLLLANVGEKARAKGDLDLTSEYLGIRELRKFLSEAGVSAGDVHFEEGSGLSRNNLTTPNATIKLLQFMSRHPAADAYWSALPVAGVDGTLRNRMKGTPAEGNVRAKTGTLRWAHSLSGDVKTATGERLLFSVMLNRYYNADPQRATRLEVDAIPILLAQFKGRVDE